jgi:hypothetical protein
MLRLAKAELGATRLRLAEFWMRVHELDDSG